MAPVDKAPVSASGDGDFLGLSKWTWAAIAGGVAVTGIALYIIAGSDDGKKDKKKKGKGAKKKTGTTTTSSSAASSAKPTPSKKQNVTVEDVPEEEDLDGVSEN